MMYLSLAALIFLLDLYLKNHIEKYQEKGKEKKICNGALLIRNYHNHGAFLNAGERVSPLVGGLSLILTVGVAAYFLRVCAQKDGKKLLGLSLLLGGACSNTYDRLKRGYVVDYFSFGVRWKRLRGIVFNLSDFCILAGTLLAAWQKDGGK